MLRGPGAVGCTKLATFNGEKNDRYRNFGHPIFGPTSFKIQLGFSKARNECGHSVAMTCCYCTRLQQIALAFPFGTGTTVRVPYW